MISYEPLKKTLKEKGMSARELDRKMGGSWNYLGTALSMSAYLSTKTIDKICNELNCRVSDVIAWKDGVQTSLNKGQKIYFAVDWDIIQKNTKYSGLTLTSLSKKIGLSPDVLTGAKRTSRPLSKNTIDLIAAIFGCPAESLLLHKESAE